MKTDDDFNIGKAWWFYVFILCPIVGLIVALILYFACCKNMPCCQRKSGASLGTEETDKFNPKPKKAKKAVTKPLVTTGKPFQMKKGDTGVLPSGLDAVLVCLGWTAASGVDLDASLVALDAQKNKTAVVNFHNRKSQGLSHSGDNTSGKGEGDDECIRITLAEVPETTCEIYATVNIFTNGKSFKDVSDAYVRLTAAAEEFKPGNELARYKLDAEVDTRGIVFCRLLRDGKKWKMEALAWECGGNSAESPDCLNVVKFGPSNDATPVL